MMKDVSVGIIGAANERHCVYLSRELERQGARPVILDNSPNLPFPLSQRADESYYGGMPLSDTAIYYLRALFLPTPAIDTEPIAGQIREEGYVAYAAERERYAAWLSWLKTAPLHNRHIVNPVDTLLLHFAKPYQLECLRKRQIPVPDTLVTGDAKLLRHFSRNRQVVYKPVAGGALCRLLTDEDKGEERLEALATAPVLFQEYVAGSDLRVFVLDGRVIASFLVEGEGIDYRAGETKLEPYELQPEIADLCVQACETLGLIFSGVDLKLQVDGSVVLIECNPSPMFEGFDRVSPVPIVEQLAAYLIDSAIQLRKTEIRS
jgi:hypothetical protein